MDLDEFGSFEGLDERDRAILFFVMDCLERNGYAPSYREIAEFTGLASTSPVKNRLDALQARGYLRCGGSARAISLPGREKLATVRLLGDIRAGLNRIAEQVIEDVIPLPRRLTGEGELIMLKVEGDSMIDAAITQGDMVVVRKDPEVQDGDIVAALIGSDVSADEEATIKNFRRRDGHVWLEPSNPAYEPINGDHATIIGKVVTVVRKM